MPAAFAPAKGTLPVLQYCTPDQLAIDPGYQRDLDARSHQLIRRIAAEWDWTLFQPLVVARRPDGALFVVDGQHRLAAAKLRGDVGNLPCVIVHPGDPADEAAVFVQLNQQRRPLTPFALYNAALAAGDETALALNTVLRQSGLSFAGSADAGALKPGQINIVNPVRRWHGRHGDAATRATLATLARLVTAHGTRHATTLFFAIASVVLAQGERLNAHLLAEVADRPVDEWLADFHAHAAANGVGIQAAASAILTAAYAEALREIEDDTDPVAPEPPREPANPRTREPANPRTREPANPRTREHRPRDGTVVNGTTRDRLVRA